MVKLCKSAESVKSNIDCYWEGARKNPDLIKDAGKVRQWKVYRNNKGEWRFGPSRFVGYERMTPDKYVERKAARSGGLSGTETEQHLKQWTENVPKSSKLHVQLLDAVSEFLGEVDISVSRAASFSTLMVGSDSEFSEETQSSDVEVEALVTLSKRLTPVHLRKLTRRLEAIHETMR